MTWIIESNGVIYHKNQKAFGFFDVNGDVCEADAIAPFGRPVLRQWGCLSDWLILPARPTTQHQLYSAPSTPTVRPTTWAAYRLPW